MLRQGITLAMGGVILGAIFSFALMGFLRSLVFGVTITDPVTFLAASAILTAASGSSLLGPFAKGDSHGSHDRVTARVIPTHHN